MLRAGVAFFYFSFGIEKFGDGHNTWIPIFERIGWGQWFRVATGVIEVAGAVLYLLPWTTMLAAGLLSATMLGAVVAHLTVLEDPGSGLVPAVALVATIAIALREREQHIWPVTRRD